jgi:hypothetical protein
MKIMKMKLPKPSKLWNRFVSRALGSQMRHAATEIAMELLDDAGFISQGRFDTFREESEKRIASLEQERWELKEQIDNPNMDLLAQQICYQSLGESVDNDALASALSQDAEFISRSLDTLNMDDIASKITEHIDVSDIAQHVDADEVANKMCSDDVADHMSKSEVADQLDKEEIASHIDVSELAGNISIDAEDFAPHMEIDSGAITEAVTEHIIQNLSITVG